MTIGYHHGYSVRIDHWSSDAELLYPRELMNFLKLLGFSMPREEEQEIIQRRKADEVEQRDWLEDAHWKRSLYPICNPIEIMSSEGGLAGTL